MKLFLLSILICCARSATVKDAETCNPSTCTGACRCSSLSSPLSDGTTPQLISITFDESVVDNLYTEYWEPLLFERTNPDGNPIGATFFVPHEYTDYSRVHDLYLRGFEIADNSITNNSSANYWSTASEDTLVQEFQGQREIISHFANIPINDIIGGRTPQLQLQGDVSINAYTRSNLQYDSSWTSRSTQMYFPYTLDYKSTQECRLGTTCPVDAHSGFWISPIIDLQANSTDTVVECNALQACNLVGTAEEITNYLLDQVERERGGNKAPMTILLSSAFFLTAENGFDGLKGFLDGLGRLNDVFLVTVKQIIDWAKNPVPLEQFRTEVPDRSADCTKVVCPLENLNGDLRYMTSCVVCPEVYPWVGNPLGSYNPTTTTPHTPRPTSAPPTTPPPSTTIQSGKKNV